MKLHLDEHEGIHVVEAYQEDAVTISGTRHTSSLVVTQDQVIPDWRPGSISDITGADLEVILDLSPEVVLLGTGRALTFLPPQMLGDFMARGIGVEFMDSHAACRTYNILAAEYRKVAAAIIIES